MDLENRIQQYNAVLTKSDEKILEYILSNKSATIHTSITDLSKKIEVSPASISRLCKRLQFESFQQMKYTLAKSDPETKSKKEIPDIISGYYETILKSTEQFISTKQINLITFLLSESRNVIFCGRGNSGVIADEFNSRTERMGINSQSMTESHAMLIKSTLMDSQDILFCFSFSGQTKSVIDSASIAKDNGVKVIVVTNFDETPLTKVADEVVLISSHTHIEDEKFVNTQIASLFLLDILTYTLLENSKFMENRKKTLKSIKEFG